MSKQNQKVGDNSQVIQSARDTYMGMTDKQMSEIMRAQADAIYQSMRMAEDLVDKRLKNFEYEVIERFSLDHKANPESFKDPDFQYVLGRAQTEYARCGEDELKRTLTDLIVERSKHSNRGRPQLAINDALERAARLTSNEISEVALTFVATKVAVTAYKSPTWFANFFEVCFDPHLDNIESDETSYLYMQSIGCGSISGVARTDIRKVLHQAYDLVFQEAFSLSNLQEEIGEDNVEILKREGRLCSIFGNPVNLEDRVVALNACSSDELKKDLKQCVPMDSPVFKFVDRKTLDKEEFLNCISGLWPNFGRFLKIWDETPIASFTLSTTGIVIGHAMFVQKLGEDVPLSIWVK